MRLPWGRARHRQRWAPRLHLRRACHAKLKGTGGLVVDGGVRDLEEMIERALPAFARRLTHSLASRLAVTAINEPRHLRGSARATGRRGGSATGQAWCLFRPSGPLRWPNWPSATPAMMRPPPSCARRSPSARRWPSLSASAKAAPGAPHGNAQGSGSVVAKVASTIRVGPRATSVCISG